MSARYLVRPKADQDLDAQAQYLATQGGVDLGHRFLVSARDTFSLLAQRPLIGWHFRVQLRGLGVIRAFSISGFSKILVLYRTIDNGVEILRVIHGSRNLRALLTREGIE